MYLLFVIGWDDTCMLIWSIDASFVVHNDMHSYTKLMLTFGRRAVFPLSNKQYVRSTSSIVAAITGVDDAIIFAMVSKIFY